MSKVLFVCLQNAGRSQMSEAYFNRLTDEAGHQSRSAGTSPAPGMHPVVVEAMTEAGFDLSERTPEELSMELAEWADVVVTMGCDDKCPYVPGTRYIDWELEDPADQEIAAVRETRNEIELRVVRLLAELAQNAS
ncbi:MAG: arsenate reductase ArsC [Thermoleophilia bacterium]|nr:arsenate reductase ArsC [Thermoleophilia bacterium]